MSPTRQLVVRSTHVLKRTSRLFTSERAGRILVSLASLVTIIGLPIAVLQLCDLRGQQANRAASILMAVDQQLATESNRAIRHAILTRRPLKASDEALGDYLDVLEGLALNYERRLLDLDSIDDWHGDTIVETYQNSEIQTRFKRTSPNSRKRTRTTTQAFKRSADASRSRARNPHPL